jgi:ABC-type branched-subunit amino acid transport system substrate-binding protein
MSSLIKSLYIIFTFVAIVVSSIYLGSSNNPYQIKNNTIILGQSAALSGTAKNLGTEFRKGAISYFNHINQNGGISGNKILLKTKDDKYEPKLTIENTNLFVDENVFALFGAIGTPTSKVALPIALKNNIPYIMPFTGASLLRDDFDKNIINFRASYNQEMEKIIKYLVDDLGHRKIAVFYQYDSYGKAGLSGVNLAMQNRNKNIIAKASYKRNTLSITNALKVISKSKPDAIVMIGAYKACSYFIKRAKKDPNMENALFCNISFVGSYPLMKSLNNDTKNVIISQVVPLPWDRSNKLVEEYQELFAKEYPDDTFGFVSLEGFIAAKIVSLALLNSKNITRDEFVQSILNLQQNSIDGIKLNFAPTSNQGSNLVLLTKFENNKFIVIDTKDNK